MRSRLRSVSPPRAPESSTDSHYEPGCPYALKLRTSRNEALGKDVLSVIDWRLSPVNQCTFSSSLYWANIRQGADRSCIRIRPTRSQRLQDTLPSCQFGYTCAIDLTKGTSGLRHRCSRRSPKRSPSRPSRCRRPVACKWSHTSSQEGTRACRSLPCIRICRNCTGTPKCTRRMPRPGRFAWSPQWRTCRIGNCCSRIRCFGHKARRLLVGTPYRCTV